MPEHQSVLPKRQEHCRPINKQKMDVGKHPYPAIQFAMYDDKSFKMQKVLLKLKDGLSQS